MSEVIRYEAPSEDNSLILLSAESWCGPCRQFAPVFERAANEHEGDIKFYKVDVDDNPELALKYNVMSVPTVIRAVDGDLEPVEHRRPVPFLNYVKSL